MHEQIYEFVGRYFDRRQNQTVDERRLQLRDESPYLFEGLCHIRRVPFRGAFDSEVRFQYLEVEGPRRISSTTRSKVVLEAAAYFYAKVYETLAIVYGDRMSEEVMVVCPFEETLEWWDHVIEERLSRANLGLAAQGKRLLSRNHHPRIISNDEDKDISSNIVIIDPANQDGTKFGQGFFKQEMVKKAISRAKEVVIIIGNPCEPYCDRYTLGFADMTSALDAAHQFAHICGGLLRYEDNGIEEPLVSLGDIPQALLLDEEREAYAKLKESGDVDEVKW